MRTITFYSYKGGVGRTLALANMVNRLSEFNKKICLLDFDLEAPGLPYKFPLSKRAKPITKGIVDYIYEYYVNGNLPASIKEYSRSFPIHTSKGLVHLIPAGDTNSTEYWKKLSAINWYDLLYENENGIAFFLDLKEKIRKELNPDFLLIDSRTGITETSGITMSIFADEVVVVSANNGENLEGAQKIIKSISNKENSITGKMPKVTFVLSRIPFTDKESAKESGLVGRVRALFDPTVIGDINVIHSDRELEERERLKIGYDNEDASASQVSRDYLKLFEKIFNEYLSTGELKRFKDIKLAERLYAKARVEENIENKIQYINQAISLDTNNDEYYIFKANSYRLNKKYKEAIGVCNSILSRDPKFLEAYFILGESYFAENQFDEALKVYEQVLKIDPDNSVSYECVGIIYNSLKDDKSAVSFFTKAIEFDAENADAYNARANSYRLLGDAESAFNDAYKSIELNPDDAVAYGTLAEINAQLNNENEFYINIERALNLAENDKKKHNNNVARETLEKSIKTDPLYKPFYKKERFQKILDKYNIILLDEDEEYGIAK